MTEGVTVKSAEQEAVEFQQAWAAANRENAKLRARIAELTAALKEVHRRTGLLMTQNQGRWNMSLEHDRRTADVLSVNQDISSAALGEKHD